MPKRMDECMTEEGGHCLDHTGAYNVSRLFQGQTGLEDLLRAFIVSIVTNHK